MSMTRRSSSPNVVFYILDLNHHGDISQQESVQAQRLLAQTKTLQLPEASNSPTNLVIEQGKLPREWCRSLMFATPNTNTKTNTIVARTASPWSCPAAVTERS